VVFTAWRGGHLHTVVSQSSVAPRKLEKLALQLLRAQSPKRPSTILKKKAAPPH
jgi:hypothetical protein